jgi:threonylcarbamoyladenosine tRNA methylthiotransferase MtaB
MDHGTNSATPPFAAKEAALPAERRYRIATLGCKVNQYESQYLKETLEAAGYREAGPGETAQLCLINTCTVTAEADAQSRQVIRRLARAHPGAAVVVVGCYAARDPEAVARLPGVTQVLPDKARWLEGLRPFGVQELPRGIRRFDGRTRAFVQVQDGCLLTCTYCIIPQVRPRLQSRDPEEIAAEVAQLTAAGYQEIVLTGIHLGHYGLDRSRGRPKEQWCRLWHLLERLEQLPGVFRLRLSSLEAAEVRDDLVRVLAQSRRLVPHLHLCLQSGSDRILARMRRRYRTAGFLERCRRLQEALDLPALTTDVIVGFPGETEEDFQATCQVLRQVGFSRVHIFPFSPRPGTPAADFPDPVPPAVIAERRRRLQELEQELAEAYYRQLLGRRLEVLVEEPVPERPGWVRGTACRYAPVFLPGWAPALMGKLVPVYAEAIEEGMIRGRPLPEPPTAPPAPTASPLLRSQRLSLPLIG